MKAIQFELWTECNVGCNFCYLEKRVRKTSEENKLNGIRRARAFLDAGDMKDYTVIAYIGGEFLQGQLNTPTVRNEFFDLLWKTKEYIQEGKLQGAWLSAALTQESDDLKEVLEMFKDVEQRVKTGGFWIVTSYDTKWRFTKKTEAVWHKNMALIKESYPNILKNTSVILTQDCIERYLRGEFRFQDFVEKYDTHFFFKPPHLIKEIYRDKEDMESKLPGFFLKRKDYIKFLTTVLEEEEGFIFDKICNINFRADTLLRSGTDVPEYREKNTRYQIANELFLPCGHPFPYGGYIDHDGCMLCDKLALT